MLKLSAQGVVWDFDGTLFDSFELWLRVMTQVLQRHAIAVPERDTFVKNRHAKLIDAIGIVSGVGGGLLDVLYHDFIQSEEQYYEHPEDLYFSDALDLLKRNHEAGLKQIIISNRPHYNDARLGSPRNLAKRLPLAGLIDAAVCGDDSEEFHKPDARTLDSIEQELGISRADLIVIGDQFVDAELAHSLEVKAVLVQREGEEIPHLEQLADGWQEKVAIVTSLDEVSIRRD